jgi:hypothetical protein
VQGTTGGGGSIPGANNEVLTSDGAGGATAESNLTFDGTTLTLVGSSEIDGGGGALRWLNGSTFWAGSGGLASTGATATMGSSQVNRYPNFQGWAEPRYNGLVLTDVTFTSSGSANQGQLCNMRADGTWELADADNSSASLLLGIALDNVTADGQFSVLLNGIYSTSYHEQIGASTDGAPLYVSRTAGSVTETAPSSTGNYVRLIGHNICDGTDVVVVRFDPDCTWIVI